MRTKTEEKREAILAVAAEVFREVGFSGASMSEICTRVGGSKATLYNYFPSKEELFFEVMFRSTEAEFEATHQALDPSTDDVAACLRHFGEQFLALLYSEKVLSVRRLIIAESGRAHLGHLCYARGPERSQAMMAEFLASAMAKGKLRPADPRVATLHLRALLEAELLDCILFHIDRPEEAGSIASIVSRAIDVFMIAYGPTRDPQPSFADSPRT
ncbi:TetR/AcrR family transcriptional regulator [Propionivibrio sp.]|uniref:TetR/AcrR family transcriptional regulator n=1 Tax=Propionivibrio sp. TaxID=2212460 RepID=UPI00272E8B3D|nr:TetR/AcrR family transcriptional regulator [Propionivibrio sp.]